jgi:hypothetical protein
VAFVVYRGCAVRPVSDPPELLDEPPPDDEDPLPDDDEPLPDDELPLLDCVAPEGVTLARLLDVPLELPLSPLVAASRVRTRV